MRRKKWAHLDRKRKESSGFQLSGRFHHVSKWALGTDVEAVCVLGAASDGHLVFPGFLWGERWRRSLTNLRR